MVSLPVLHFEPLRRLHTNNSCSTINMTLVDLYHSAASLASLASLVIATVAENRSNVTAHVLEITYIYMQHD